MAAREEDRDGCPRTGVVVPITSVSFDQLRPMLDRIGIDSVVEPAQYLEFLHVLAYAHDVAEQRKRLGMYGMPIDKYTDGRRLLKDYLANGGRTSWLVGNDRACAMNLGSEFTWGDVLAIWTTHNTRGTARINVWDVDDWEQLENAVDKKAPVTRQLARDLGISRTTIARMYRMHGVDP